jgi:hypothetical protein
MIEVWMERVGMPVYKPERTDEEISARVRDSVIRQLRGQIITRTDADYLNEYINQMVKPDTKESDAG